VESCATWQIAVAMKAGCPPHAWGAVSADPVIHREPYRGGGQPVFITTPMSYRTRREPPDSGAPSRSPAGPAGLGLRSSRHRCGRIAGIPAGLSPCRNFLLDKRVEDVPRGGRAPNRP